MIATPSIARRRGGFTVIELLVVLAVVSLLAAILIPAVASSRLAANSARTRTQFAQWSAAIESFRSEYGFYPVFDSTNKVNGGVTETDHPFHDVLAGRRRDGTALELGSLAAQNKKRVSFHTFTPSDFGDLSADVGLLCDGFGNTDIAVLCDRNGDGVVSSADYDGSLPTVAGIAPSLDDFPASGVHARIIFYAPAPGATDAPRLIMSWK
jgi:prepilin-type N-terminal cleavage/methylation domain-containing protein